MTFSRAAKSLSDWIGGRISQRNNLNEPERAVYRKLNQLIKKVTEDIEQFRFNTAIAAMMEFMNDYTQVLCNIGETQSVTR